MPSLQHWKDKTTGRWRYRHKVNETRAKLKSILDYFLEWERQSKERKEPTSFLAPTLWVSIFGFLDYAESVLMYARLLPNNKVIFRPFLHSNQSTIENVFSQLRAMRRDNPQGVAKGLMAQNLGTTSQMKAGALKNNPMYTQELLGNEQSMFHAQAPVASATSTSTSAAISAAPAATLNHGTVPASMPTSATSTSMSATSMLAISVAPAANHGTANHVTVWASTPTLATSTSTSAAISVAPASTLNHGTVSALTPTSATSTSTSAAISAAPSMPTSATSTSMSATSTLAISVAPAANHGTANHGTVWASTPTSAPASTLNHGTVSSSTPTSATSTSTSAAISAVPASTLNHGTVSASRLTSASVAIAEAPGLSTSSALSTVPPISHGIVSSASSSTGGASHFGYQFKARQDMVTAAIKQRPQTMASGSSLNFFPPAHQSTSNTVEEKIRQLFSPVWNGTIHFSKVLIDRQDFIRVAEISALGPAWTFLKHVIEGKTIDVESRFDALCIHINGQILVQYIAVIGKIKTQAKQSSFHKRIHRVIVSGDVFKAMKQLGYQEIFQESYRYAIPVLVQVLARLFLDKIREGSQQKAPTKAAPTLVKVTRGLHGMNRFEI